MKFFTAVFLLFMGFTLAAQEAPDTRGAVPPAGREAPRSAGQNAAADAEVFVIRTINYHLTGATQSWALAHRLELEEGEVLRGRAAFDEYIERKRQDLKNERVLREEFSVIEFSLGAAEENGNIPVTLDVHARDTWNLIALPYPKFDSNSGFSLTIKARDYNFLGLMTPLRLDLGYQFDENQQHRFNFLIDMDFPFRALGLHWNVNFDNELKYIPGDPLQYRNTTGLSVEIPWGETTFNLGVNQNFILNEENSDDEKRDVQRNPEGLKYFKDAWYMSSDFWASWGIPLLEKTGYGKLTYTPSVSFNLRYRPGGSLDYGGVGYYRRGPSVSLSHSLGFGRTDWIGNYRKGYSVGLGNGNSFNFADSTWSNSISFNTTAHLNPAPWIGITMRFIYQQLLNSPDNWEYYFYAGDVLRGILDDQLYAKSRLSFNLEIPFRILRFTPAQWFNQPKLRFMEFEMHAGPFVDLAMFHGWDGVPNAAGSRRVDFTFGNLYATGGLEVIVFPLAWRAFYVRGSVGGDFMDFIQSRSLSFRREYFIGIGHYF